MKNFLAPILTGTILVVSGCAQTNGSLYQYPFNSAKIVYSINGTTEGTSTLTIKGDKSIRESHIIFHKPTGDEKQDNLYIDDGKNVYSVDLAKKVGAMTPNPLYNILTAVDPSMRQDTLTKLAVGMSPDQAATQQSQTLGKETVAGQECIDYDTGGFGQMCLWNSIPLKTNISIPDLGLTNNTIATSIQTNVDVADNAFDVPADITMQQVGATGATTQQENSSAQLTVGTMETTQQSGQTQQ